MNSIVKRGLELAESMTRQQQKAMFARRGWRGGTTRNPIFSYESSKGWGTVAKVDEKHVAHTYHSQKGITITKHSNSKEAKTAVIERVGKN